MGNAGGERKMATSGNWLESYAGKLRRSYSIGGLPGSHNFPNLF